MCGDWLALCVCICEIQKPIYLMVPEMFSFIIKWFSELTESQKTCQLWALEVETFSFTEISYFLHLNAVKIAGLKAICSGSVRFLSQIHSTHCMVNKSSLLSSRHWNVFIHYFVVDPFIDWCQNFWLYRTGLFYSICACGRESARLVNKLQYQTSSYVHKNKQTNL